MSNESNRPRGALHITDLVVDGPSPSTTPPSAIRVVRQGAVRPGDAIIWVSRIAGPYLGWTFVKTKYDQDWLASIKLGVLPAYRRWVPDQRAWAFHPDAVEGVINITMRFFPRITKLENDPMVDMVLPPEGTESRVETLREEISNDSRAAIDSGVLAEFGKRKVEV